MMKPALPEARGLAYLLFLLFAGIFPAAVPQASGQRAAVAGRPEFVLILSRHGVRSPTSTAAQLNRYSARPWPQWQVPPGYLTAHGYRLLVQFGAWDRAWLNAVGILPRADCSGNAVYIYADSNQRTIASGHALAEGLSPACPIEVHSMREGERDPLFHPLSAKIGTAAWEQALDAVRQRIHGDATLPTTAHHVELEKLQDILNGCSSGRGCGPRPALPAQPLLQVPATLTSGEDDHLFDLHGPLATASTLSEDILLEYANGFPQASVGWGQVDGQQTRSLIHLHTAYFELTQRTPLAARLEASNLLGHIIDTLDQAVSGHSVTGALGKPGQKVVFLVGHDTNLAAVASLLHLTWTADGRTDDTPPGAELSFVVVRDRQGHAEVELKYSVQRLEQMRDAVPLNPGHPPAQVTLRLPGSSSPGPLYQWEDFRRVAESAIDPAFVVSIAGTGPYQH